MRLPGYIYKLHARIADRDDEALWLYPLRMILSLASIFYYLGVMLHRLSYWLGLNYANRFDGMVICVGNIVAGGTGKTPIAMMVAQIISRHENTAIVTRGYKRKHENRVIVVSDTEKILADPQVSGDEAYMMAMSSDGIPIIAAARRYQGAIKAQERYGSTIIVLDDGLQHYGIRKDVVIITVDCRNPLGGGWLLPRGYLRVPAGELAMADIIIITNAVEDFLGKAIASIRRYAPDTRLFKSRYIVKGLINPLTMESMSLTELEGKRYLAFCGIGNPSSFRRSLDKLPGELIDLIIFPDHHEYGISDIHAIESKAEQNNADLIITTQKDQPRLIPHIDMERLFYSLDIKPKIEPLDRGKSFRDTLLDLVIRKTAP